MWPPNDVKALRRKMLKWFDQHQRDLPWRKNRTPYRIWVSEIMLQQTQVATVVDYYLRFMKRFPSVKSLASAPQAEVLKLWEGLGYYRRARQMHAAAQRVVEQHGGVFPKTYDEVLALPGIGRYTAGAILSIACDQRLPILEGNTIRLHARLLEMDSDPRASTNQKQLWKFADLIVPQKHAGDFNQSLMELGSEVCKPKKPLCDACPIRDLCPTFVKGLQNKIPVAGKKINYEDLCEAVVLVKKKTRGTEKYLVRTCGENERWTGLWDFPRYEIAGAVTQQQVQQKLTMQVADQFGLHVEMQPLGSTIKHTVTRFRITLSCLLTTSVTGRLKKQPTPTKWCNLQELQQLPMSVTGRKIVELLLTKVKSK